MITNYRGRRWPLHIDQCFGLQEREHKPQVHVTNKPHDKGVSLQRYTKLASQRRKAGERLNRCKGIV